MPWWVGGTDAPSVGLQGAGGDRLGSVARVAVMQRLLDGWPLLGAQGWWCDIADPTSCSPWWGGCSAWGQKEQC